MRKKLLYGFIIIVILAISVTLYGMSRSNNISTSSTIPVEVPKIEFEVTKETIQQTIQVKGKSTYADETRIYAPYDGTIHQWYVEEGEEIHQGDVLFTMDSDSLQKQLEIKQSDYEQLSLELQLEETRAKVSGEQVATASENGKEEAFERYASEKMYQLERQMKQIQLETLRNEIEELKTKLSQSSYQAPKSGIFLFEEEKEPKSVSEQKQIGKIVELDRLEMHTTVGEYEVFKLKEGMEVNIQIDAFPLEKLTGTVTHVSKFALHVDNSSNSQFPVTIELDPHEKLIAGLSLTGNIVTDYKEDVIVVPTIAVQKDEDEYYVDKWDGQEVKRQPIKIGLETAEHTEILEGLNEGDIVVLQ